MPLFKPSGEVVVDSSDKIPDVVGNKISGISGVGITAIVERSRPIVEYFFNEASSGQVPTAVLDQTTDPINLNITYVGANPAYTSITAGDGLSFASGSTGTLQSSNIIASKLMDSINFCVKLTIQFVINYSNDNNNYIWYLGDDQNDWFIYIGANYGTISFVVNDLGQNFSYQTFDYYFPIGTGLQVVTFVFDSTQTVEANRVLLYIDTGSGATLISPSAYDPPAQFEKIIFGTQDNAGVYLYSNYVNGIIYYAAIYNMALSSATIIEYSTALLANNDASPAPLEEDNILDIFSNFHLYAPSRADDSYTGIILSNGNGISFGLSSNIITASSVAIAAYIAGTQTATQANHTIVFSNSNNISFGISGNSLTGSVVANAGNIGGLSAGTQIKTNNFAEFENSNNITFGLNLGLSQITATFTRSTSPNAISAGTTFITNGTAILSNSNNISFGMNAGTITASVSAAGANISGISGGTTKATSGGIIFSNSNGVSFGVNGNTITALAYSPPTSGIFEIEDDNANAASTGTFVLSNSNNISFGMNGQTITASVGPIMSIFDYPPLQFATGSGGVFSNATLAFVPWTIDNYLSATQGKMLFSASLQTSAANTIQGSISIAIGLYTNNANTLSLASSGSKTYVWSATSNGSTSVYNGVKEFTVPINVSATPGQYWLGYWIRTSSARGTLGLTHLGGIAHTQYSGPWGVSANTTQGVMSGLGYYSASQTTLLSSAALSDINQQSNIRMPWCGLRATS